MLYLNYVSLFPSTRPSAFPTARHARQNVQISRIRFIDSPPERAVHNCLLLLYAARVPLY